MTKFVRRGGSHNPTHISQNLPHALVYIAEMQGGPHILIVDDHREIRDLVSRALTKEGFQGEHGGGRPRHAKGPG